eukprot:764787-Hanusia_phi.AAC.1
MIRKIKSLSSPVLPLAQLIARRPTWLSRPPAPVPSLRGCASLLSSERCRAGSKVSAPSCPCHAGGRAWGRPRQARKRSG